MAALAGPLSLPDMRDLAAYLAASGPYVPETAEAGSWAHEKVRRDCTICHGESGMGVMTGVPVLTGQHEDYLVHALQAYRDGSRADATMGPVAKALAPEEIGRLAAYFAAQTHLKPNAAADVAGSADAADARDAADAADAANPAETAEVPTRATASEVARTIVMIDVPAGEFVMGTAPSAGFQNGYPPHAASVAAFRLGATEVTFAQFDAFARATGRALPPDEHWGRGPRPVIHVEWADAHAFIDWLSAGTGRRFRLPSEAEWEYAARAGTATLYPWGERVDHALVNNSVDEGADRWTYTAPVGGFPPNAFGLLDMLGNVWELVQDCRHATYEGAPADGSAWLDEPCESRIARGGSWGSTRRGVQPAARGAASEHFESMDLGFRLAEDL
jgi:formylglycine-generating enzyme required for sulfatase activity